MRPGPIAVCVPIVLALACAQPPTEPKGDGGPAGTSEEQAGSDHPDAQESDAEVKMDHLLTAAQRGDAEAQTELAAILDDAGASDRALEYARAAAAQASAEGENVAAWLLATREDPTPQDLDEALQYAAWARTQKPDACNIADTLGWVFVKKRLVSDGLQYLEFATTGKCACQDEGGRRYRLAFAYESLGQHERAIAVLRQLLGSNVYFDERDDAAALLERLGGTAAALPEATSEEYAVYSTVLRDLDGPLVLQRETLTHATCDPDQNVSSIEHLLEHGFPGRPIGDDLVESFFRKVTSSARLEPAGLASPDTRIVPGAEIRSALREWGAEKMLEERFPNTQGAVEFSRVGFARDGTQALVELRTRPWLGIAHYYLLVKVGGRWEIAPEPSGS